MNSSNTMRRLDFRLPEWTRIGWTSQKARDVWEPRMRAISNAFLDIEVESVAQGLRSAVRRIVRPDQLPEVANAMARKGLSMLPMRQVEMGRGGYSIKGRDPQPGEPWEYSVLFHHGLSALADDDASIGKYLGYPPCCIRFFGRVWNREGYIDTTWPMAVANADGREGIVATTPLRYCNILGRWQGIRAVPHLPCSFHCAPTQAMGEQFVALGREMGFTDQMDNLDEILSWPVEWNALHGIAEITSPVLRVSTVTDATPDKYVVQLEGDQYPAEGASGLTFPFQQKANNVLTTGRTFRSISTPAVNKEWYWRDNGFETYKAQVLHHKPLIDGIRRALQQTDGELKVLDLGCGNGALLLEAAEQSGPFATGMPPPRRRSEWAEPWSSKFLARRPAVAGCPPYAASQH